MANTAFVFKVDNKTGQQTIMQADHTYIHEELAFSVVLDMTAISSAYHIALETPSAGTEIHYRPSSQGLSTDTAAIKFEFRGAITSYTGGDTYTPFNRYASSAKTSEVVVKYGVTPTLGTPTLYDLDYIGTAGNPVSRTGGTGGGGDEIILKPDSIYLWTITPSAETNAGFKVFWYEEGE